MTCINPAVKVWAVRKIRMELWHTVASKKVWFLRLLNLIIICIWARKFIIIAFSNLLYVIEPSSLHGCRGPDEIFEMKPCESCCIQDGKDCIKKSRDCALECGTWYNTRENLFDQRCPYGCPKCASCLLRDEEQLMSLKPPEQCNPKDCKTMEIGVDPCFAPGCECFCSEANRLMEKCPDVKPDWLPG